MSRTITRTFTPRNELDHVIYPTGPPVAFTYDEEGNPRTMTDALLGTTETIYDPMGRPQSYTDAFGKTLSFDYNENGDRRHITYPGNKQITLDYDDAGRPWKLTDWLGRVIERSYSDAGRPLRVDFPNGVKTEFTHDAAGRFKTFAHRLGAAPPFASTSLTLSNAGDIKQFDDTPPLGPYLPPSTLTYTNGTANQLATINGNPVTHDFNGNLLSGNLNGTTPHTLTFDFEDRLLSLTTAGQTNSNRYDGRGHRLETTQGGSTTRYVVDPHASLSQIMAETDTTGNVTAYYLYFGGLAARVLPNGTASYYHVNHQGSIIALTAGDGSITDTYQYDPFGVPMGSTGSSTNHFRYLGGFGLWDNGDGTVFARARHFDPLLGRFLSRDPLRGTDTGTQTINRYIYALNNPLRFTDASGLTARDMSMANSTPSIVNRSGKFSGAKVLSYATDGYFVLLATGEVVLVASDIAAIFFPVAEPETAGLTIANTTALEARIAAINAETEEVAPATEAEMVTVYRGVHANHPQHANALKGIAEPMGGHADPVLHNAGDNGSNIYLLDH